MKVRKFSLKALSMLLVVMMIMTAVPVAFAAKTQATEGDALTADGRAVLYIANSGTADGGASAAAPFYGTPAETNTKLAEILAADPDLKQDEVVVVICGIIGGSGTTVAWFSNTRATAGTDPGFKIVYTSYFDDGSGAVDYRATNNAKWGLATSTVARTFSFNWDAEFDYVHFYKSGTGSQYFHAEHHDFIFKESCSMGFGSTLVETSPAQYPMFFGGSANPTTAETFSGTQNILLGAGTWYHVKSGDRLDKSSGTYVPSVTTGIVNFTISGGRYLNPASATLQSQQYTGALGWGSYDGATVNFNITGGTFLNTVMAYNTAFYGMSKYGAYQKCDINMNISGGTFNKGVRCVQIYDNTTSGISTYYLDIEGTLNLNVTGGTFPAGEVIDGKYNTANLPHYDINVNYDPYVISDTVFTGINTASVNYDTANTDVLTFSYPLAADFADFGALKYSGYDADADIISADYITHDDANDTFTVPVYVTDTASTVVLTRVVDTTRYTYTYNIAGTGTALTTASPVAVGNTEEVDLAPATFAFPESVSSLGDVYAIYNSVSTYGATTNIKEYATAVAGGFTLVIPKTTLAATVTLVTVSGNTKTTYTYDVTGNGTALAISAASAGVDTEYAGTSRVDGNGNIRATLFVGGSDETGNGTSPTDLFYGTPYEIIAKLNTIVGVGGTSSTEALVVLCGNLDNHWNVALSALPTAPAYRVIYTSYYMDTDYREAGAKWTLSNTAVTAVMEFNWDAEFDYINFEKILSNVQFIIANYHDFVLKPSCAFTYTFNPALTETGTGTTADDAPIFFGGRSNPASSTVVEGITQNIEIGAGKWYYVKSGDRIATTTTVGRTLLKDSTVNFKITGGEYLFAVAAGLATAQAVSATGQNLYDGTTVNFDVSGGTFAGYVAAYGSGYYGFSKYQDVAEKITGYDNFIQKCDINMNVTGGTFKNGIRGVQIYAESAGTAYYAEDIVQGTFNFSITGGSVAKNSTLNSYIDGRYDTANLPYYTAVSNVNPFNPSSVEIVNFTSENFNTAVTKVATFNYPDAAANWADYSIIKYSTHNADANIYAETYITHDDTAKTFTLPLYVTDTAATVIVGTVPVNCETTAYTFDITEIPSAALTYATSADTVAHTYVLTAEHNGVDGKTADFLGIKCSVCGDVQCQYTIDENGPVIYYRALKTGEEYTGNGTSPADFAYEIIPSLEKLAVFGKGGTIVVIGPATPGNIVSPVGIGGTVTITNVYDGHDYRFGSTTQTAGVDDANGAYFAFYGDNNHFRSDIILKDLDLMSTVNMKYISLHGNNFTVNNVRTGNVTVDESGNATNFTEGDAEATLTAPKYFIILGSYLTSASAWDETVGANQTVNIDSGRWFGIVAGNHRRAVTNLTGATLNDGAGVSGKATINITGGYFNNTGNTDATLKYDGITLVKGINTSADYSATVNISGGDFSTITTMYAKGRTATNTSGETDTTRGTLTYNISGGTFNATDGLTIKAYPTAESANTSAPQDMIIVNVLNPELNITVDGTDVDAVNGGVMVVNNKVASTNLTVTNAANMTASVGTQGFSIRTDAPAGIRYKATVPTAQRDKVLGTDNYQLVEYGILAKAAGNTAAMEWYDGASDPATHGKLAKSISFADGTTAAAATDVAFKTTADDKIFTSVLMNLTGLETVDFSFRAYAVYNVGTAEAPRYMVVYGNNIETTSIAAVAKSIVESGTYDTQYPDGNAYIEGLAAMIH